MNEETYLIMNSEQGRSPINQMETIMKILLTLVLLTSFTAQASDRQCRIVQSVMDIPAEKLPMCNKAKSKHER